LFGRVCSIPTDNRTTAQGRAIWAGKLPRPGLSRVFLYRGKKITIVTGGGGTFVLPTKKTTSRRRAGFDPTGGASLSLPGSRGIWVRISRCRLGPAQGTGKQPGFEWGQVIRGDAFYRCWTKGGRGGIKTESPDYSAGPRPARVTGGRFKKTGDAIEKLRRKKGLGGGGGPTFRRQKGPCLEGRGREAQRRGGSSFRPNPMG